MKTEAFKKGDVVINTAVSCGRNDHRLIVVRGAKKSGSDFAHVIAPQADPTKVRRIVTSVLVKVGEVNFEAYQQSLLATSKRFLDAQKAEARIAKQVSVNLDSQVLARLHQYDELVFERTGRSAGFDMAINRLLDYALRNDDEFVKNEKTRPERFLDQLNSYPNRYILAVLNRLVDEVDALMGESTGVAGLHLNGEVANWESILSGGAFERIAALDEAKALIKRLTA